VCRGENSGSFGKQAADGSFHCRIQHPWADSRKSAGRRGVLRVEGSKKCGIEAAAVGAENGTC
jgi:hypothetical protein